MPVWEIKEPLGVSPSPIKPLKKGVAPVVSVSGIRAIDRLLLKREWLKEEKHPRHGAVSHGRSSISRVKMLVDQVNSNLAACGIKIHLVLAMKDEVWGLDIYDCSCGEECRIIHDVAIDLDELSNLLASLQREVGIMLDRVL